MSHEEQKIKSWRDRYVRYPKLTYAQMQQGLMKVLVRVEVGRNGWAVMAALCSQVYADGRLGAMSSQRIQEWTDLNERQVARGMAELRNKRVIEPIMRTTSKGYRHRDRSNFSHVAQYRFTKTAWDIIDKEICEEKTSSSANEGSKRYYSHPICCVSLGRKAMLPRWCILARRNLRDFYSNRGLP